MIRLHRRIAGRDDGQSLVLVMLIATLVLIMLGTASTTLVNQINPTGTSIASGQALAAAEAGIEDFTAQINAQCSDDDSFQCAWAIGQSSNPTVTDPKAQTGTPVPSADGSATNEAYVWKVSYATSGFARVVSTGQALDANGTPRLTKTLVADVGATPSFNNFEYFTKYETFPSDFLNDFYRARDIQITSSSNASGSSLSGPGTLHWNGACTSSDPSNPSICVPSGASSSQWSTNVCDDLYYPSDDGPGRGTDAAWSNATRRPNATVQGAMGTDGTFAYYTEQGRFSPTSGSPVAETHTDVCDSSFEPNMVMNGPIYSQDAYLVDRGKDTGNSKNSMPIFGGYAYSMWNGVINNVQQPKGPNQGYARPYPNTDGQITTDLSPQPVYTTNKLELPANADKSKAFATCTYTGPTRILVKQNLAYVTSPDTPTSPAPAGPSYCYTSTGTFANSGGGGVVNAQVPISSTLIYVANPATDSHPAATRSNPIFNLSSTQPVPGPAPLLSLLAAFVNNTYSATAACALNLAPTLNRQDFDCEASGTPTGGHAPDVYGNILAAINATLNTGGLTQTLLQTLLTANISAQLNTSALSGKPYYQVTVGLPTVSTKTSTPSDLSPSDPFFQSSSSGGYTTTTLSTSVSIDRCTTLLCGSKDKTNIVSGSVSVGLSTGTPLVTKKTWPWFGAQTGSSTYTDPNNDISQYEDGYGDAYVEGTLNGSMTIVAEHDIVATNDITYSNTDLKTTSDGLALVANHDVRVYRPMTCTDDGAAGATTPGYCPNDLTGVFNSPLSWPLPTNYPSLKYVPDNAPSMTTDGQGVIYASVFTLRGCFMIDNFYRGGIGREATLYGGLYQYHRGPTSLPYQGRPYQGSTTKMPGIVLTYNYDNMRAGQTDNGGLRVPWIPNPVGRPAGSVRTWNVTSISTGS